MARSGINQNPFEDLDIQIKPKYVLAGLIALVVLVGLLTSFYTVAPEGKVVVKRFGRVVAIREPGLHFKRPFLIDRHYFVPTERVLKQEFGFTTKQAGQQTQYVVTLENQKESIMLTGDLNVIDVKWVVQYRISDPDKYLHRLRNQTETIRVIAESVMRRIVGNRLGSDVLTVARAEIAILAQQDMQRILTSYDMGVHINTIQLQDVTPPDPVKPAFNEVNESQQQRDRLVNEAEKRRMQKIPRAKGQANKIISQAEGYAAERVNLAKGEAERFKAIYEVYRQAPDITRRRLYLEMIDQIMPKIGKVYIVEPGQMAPIPLLNLD